MPGLSALLNICDLFSGSLGFDLDHTQVALRLIVVERDCEILYKKGYPHLVVEAPEIEE